MEKEISSRTWLTVLIASLAGMAVGGVLLGPPGAVAMSVICGRGAYGQCCEADGAR